MTALFINIKIDNKIKYNIFKNTLLDLKGIFNEFHIKYRGSHTNQCIEYTKKIFNENEKLSFYQDLQGDDWVEASLYMLSNVKSRSIFLYFEDHKLTSSITHFSEVLSEFDDQQLDYLCYSFFNASVLGIENILPFNPKKTKNLHSFEYSKSQNKLIGKISPRYFHFSLVSICSVEYFKSILISSDMSIKIYNSNISSLLSRLFTYPSHRYVESSINNFLKHFNMYLCHFNPSSPFNLEKIWFQDLEIKRSLKIGVLTKELYTNYDDDNGSYMESMIKRGLYPFEKYVNFSIDKNDLSGIYFKTNLMDGELYDCTYFSRNERITSSPVVHITVITGKLKISYNSDTINLSSGENMYFYSNKRPTLISMGESSVEIGVFDECY